MMKNCLYMIAAFGLITNASYANEPETAPAVEQQEVKKAEAAQESQLATLSVTVEEEKKEVKEEAKEEKLAVAPVSSKDIEEDQESEEAEKDQAVLADAQATAEQDEEESKKEKAETLLAGCADGKCPYANINDDETTTYDGRSGATKPHKA